jgi:hypothetical protein
MYWAFRHVVCLCAGVVLFSALIVCRLLHCCVGCHGASPDVPTLPGCCRVSERVKSLSVSEEVSDKKHPSQSGLSIVSSYAKCPLHGTSDLSPKRTSPEDLMMCSASDTEQQHGLRWSLGELTGSNVRSTTVRALLPLTRAVRACADPSMFARS